MLRFAKLTKTITQSAAAICALGIDEKYKEVNGKYFKDGQETKSSDETLNEDLQKKLWDLSGRYTSLEGYEPLPVERPAPPPAPVPEEKPEDNKEKEEKETEQGEKKEVKENGDPEVIKADNEEKAKQDEENKEKVKENEEAGKEAGEAKRGEEQQDEKQNNEKVTESEGVDKAEKIEEVASTTEAETNGVAE